MILQYTTSHPNAKFEKPANGDAGYDLRTPTQIEIPPLSQSKHPTPVNTHVRLAIPDGHWAKIYDRSSKAKQGIFTTAGVIDNGYRGDVIILVTNTTDKTVVFEAGEKIAQLVILQLITPSTEFVTDLNVTERGDSGFGSTGRF